MTHVYHHSDTMRLGWILDSGELRTGTAGRTEFEGLPGLGLVWATTNPDQAHSADVYHNNTRYRDGEVWAVRFTLRADDFEPWPLGLAGKNGWTPDRIKRFNATSQGDNPTDWYTCKTATLGRSSWVAIHARSYDHPVWRELKPDIQIESRIEIGKVSGLGKPCKIVKFAGRSFVSIRISEKPRQYAIQIVDLLAGQIAA